jgi:5-methylcytosine-specific restriction endonuclease McrA
MGRRKLPYARILQRDNHCVYCGRGRTAFDGRRTGSPLELGLDHVIPKCAGGTNSDRNLVIACGECNNAKGGRTPGEARMRWPCDPEGNYFGEGAYMFDPYEPIVPPGRLPGM